MIVHKTTLYSSLVYDFAGKAMNFIPRRLHMQNENYITASVLGKAVRKKKKVKKNYFF